MRVVRLLDGYVSRAFLRIFFITVLGFPIFTVLINLTDNLNRYLGRGISSRQIAIAQLYTTAEQIFFIVPAAVLFATVFTTGALSRHSELTAAKASGISFHRLVAPIFVLSLFAAGLTFAMGELAPIANQRRDELLGDAQMRRQTARYNFVYRADGGRTYAIGQLSAPQRLMQDLQIEREGTGPENPGYFLTAARADWDSTRGWTLHDGALRLFLDNQHEVAFTFKENSSRALNERPEDLLTQPKAPTQMNYRELGHYVQTLERSGSDANKLRVEQAVKIAIPVTCLIIALFGAPLGITGGNRGGGAWGVAVSLATTIVFLMSVQISKAVGSGGLLPPMVAVWIPNVVFALAGGVLFVRAKT